jgi:molybdopterin synthase sulfur carrier subunit
MISAVMKANLYATFRLLAGARSIELDLPAGSSAQDAIYALLKRLPMLAPHWLDENGELHAHVHVFLNGADIQTLPGGLQTRLAPTDTLDFFPPVAGGSNKGPRTGSAG